MALHGDIKINGQAIGFWEAVRMDDLHSVEQVSTYRWRVAVREQAADTFSHAEGLLEHRYDEGALALTQKVLAAYAAGGEGILREVAAERRSQDAKWGEQNHPDGTGQPDNQHEADLVRAATDEAFRAGRGTWRHVLAEEVAEAFAESDPARLRAELLQVAAVAAAWVEAIDRRAVAR